MTSQKPRVLCVDDEPNVLSGLQRTLRRFFDLTTAVGSEEGLSKFQTEGPFPVVLTDLRMPGMDGLAMLQALRDLNTRSVNVLLTGDADLQAAILALNEGLVFRFLTKPSEGAVLIRSLSGAHRQFQLESGQEQVLERTVRSTLDAMGHLLSPASPEAFHRGKRVAAWVRLARKALAKAESWEVDVAAELCPFGWVGLPSDVVERLQRRQALDDADEAALARLPENVLRLAGKISGLASVESILAESRDFLLPRSDGSRRQPKSWQARLLCGALLVETWLTEGRGRPASLRALREESFVDGETFRALSLAVAEESRDLSGDPVLLQEIRPGMVFCEEIVGKDGVLLVSRGQTASHELLSRLGSLAARQNLPESVLCSGLGGRN